MTHHIYGLHGTGGHGNVLTGTRHMAASCHYAASHAAFLILEAGGNAVDAGVAAGLALGVTQSDLVGVAGVAPIMIRNGRTGEVVTIDGLGVWPRRANSAYFRAHHGGRIPDGLLRGVVPGAPSAWITALARYGTMTFGEVAAAAVCLARDGFVADPRFVETITTEQARYRRWPANAAIYLPGGAPPRVGDIFRQTDLGRTLQYLCDAERAAGGSRADGLHAAHDAFYKGDIAATIAAYHDANGGWITREDLAAFQARQEAPVQFRWRDMTLWLCGAWCQGPALGMILSMLRGDDVRALGHNSPAYVHLLTEAIKRAFADREAHFGDPRFVDVPLDRLLSDAYGAERRASIDLATAWPGLVPAGRLDKSTTSMASTRAAPPLCPDTAYCAVVDKDGNVFSATPSDSSYDIDVIPGTGLAVSGRGCQSWATAGHPSEVGPGRRPRLTPNPAIATLGDGQAVMAFGTPGGDVQTQAMLQVLFNVGLFGMDLRSAVEAPRFATYAFPSSFEPHEAYPDRLAIEARVAPATLADLRTRGHDVQPWPEWTRQAGAVCAVVHDVQHGVKTAAGDPRRASYAVGW